MGYLVSSEFKNNVSSTNVFVRRKTRKSALLFAALMLSSSLYSMAKPTLANAQSAVAKHDYSIQAKSLSAALLEFSNASGINIFFDQALLGNRNTKGLIGRHTVETGLTQLLSGSGLSYSFASAKAVTIIDQFAASQVPVSANGTIVLETIDVTGGDGQSSVYSPYETAAAVAHISEENIERFRGSSPAEIFRGTTGVMSGESRNGAGSIDPNVRGMQGFGRVATTIDGAENAVTIYQGYQGVSNRTYVDPDFIAGADVTKGADTSSWGNAGSVAIRTLSVDDIVKPGNTWGIRVKGGVGGNTSDPVAGDSAGYHFKNPLGYVGDPTSGYGSATSSATGMDRPSFLSPTSGSGSVVGAYKGERFDFLGGYARRKQGNYHAGTHGPVATPVSTGEKPFCFSSGACSPTLLYRDYVQNGGLANYRAGEEVLNTQLDTESWLAKLTADIGDDQTLQLGYTGFRSEGGDRLASRLTSGTSQATQQKQTTGTSLDTVTMRYGWNPADSDLFDVKMNAYWTHLEQRNAIRGGRNVDPEDIGLPADFRSGSDTDMWGADITNLSKFSFESGDLDLTYGLSYRGEDTRGSKHTAAMEAWLTPRDGIRHEAAGFAKASYKPLNWDWLTLNAGLRYSHFWSKDRADPYERSQISNGKVISGFKTEAGGFSPSFGVTVEPFDGTQFYVNYANVMRAPSIIESVSAFNSMVANDAVKPERSSNWEIGANFNRDGLVAQDDRAMLKLGYFNWDVKDYLSRGVIVDPNKPNSLVLDINNIDRARFSGIELSGRYEVGGFTADLAANYFLNVEYCRTENTCEDKSLYADYATNHVQPQYTVDLTLSQKLLNERLMVGGRFSYVGPRAIGHGDVTAQGASQFITPVHWEPYSLVDVFTEYKVSDNLTAAFRVENLFDRYYIDPLGLVTQPGPGRTFYASLTGAFGGNQNLPSLSSPFEGSFNSADGVVDWSGFYAGVHAAALFGSESGTTTALDGTADNTSTSESADLSMSSGSFGLQAGYNFQLDNGIILGVEGDWSKTWMNGTQKTVSTEGALAESGATQAFNYYDIDWTSSLRARLGYAAGNRWMVYGTAGLALARETQSREQYRVSNGNPYSQGTQTTVASIEKEEKTRLGYTFGGGAEYAINDRWSVSANYGYSHFGKTNFSFDGARSGVANSYTETNQIGTELMPPVFEPDHLQCARTDPHPRCFEWEAPVYETIVHDSTYDVKNGRRASNSFDIHSFKVGLNYRF